MLSVIFCSTCGLRRPGELWHGPPCQCDYTGGGVIVPKDQIDEFMESRRASGRPPYSPTEEQKKASEEARKRYEFERDNPKSTVGC